MCCIPGKPESRLKSGNACYSSVQNLFIFPSPEKLQIKNTKLEFFQDIKLDFSVKEEHGVRVLDNRVLRRVFGL
jgi:hypothetical protein